MKSLLLKIKLVKNGYNYYYKVLQYQFVGQENIGSFKKLENMDRKRMKLKRDFIV